MNLCNTQAFDLSDLLRNAQALITERTRAGLIESMVCHVCHSMCWQEREYLTELHHRAIVGIDVVQTGFLRLRGGGGNTFDWNHHLIPQKEGIMHGRAHTDVGDDASHNHGGNVALAQVEIEVGAKERAVAA